MISLTQRPLHVNTQLSEQTDIRAPAGLEPGIQAREQPQTDAWKRVTTINWRDRVSSTMRRPWPTRAGVLSLFCAMDSFESLVKPSDHYSEKCI